MIKLAFIGTGTCNATSRKPQSLAFSIDGELVMVDCGGGAYHAIAALNDPDFNYSTISTIILTHYHVDHVSGLPDLLWGEMWDHTGHRTEPLTIVGPKGLHNFYQERLMPFMGDYPLPFKVDLIELKDGDIFEGNGYRVTSVALAHGDYASGYRFDFGTLSVAITGDTGYCDALVTLLSSVDKAVIEWGIASEDEYPLHLSSKDIITLIKNDAWPQNVYALHVYPVVDVDFNEQIQKMKALVASYNKSIEFPSDGDILTLIS
ncbi:MAG: MBL fold metallo-hydrolase [Spirochaetes bacterium]|nr:MBL fold metallo-hydrolase [Spirochaetota bacterium]